jgi:DNA-binding transcriptional LysR family regulator
VVAAHVGELADAEFRSHVLLQAHQRIVVRASHPVLAHPGARALCHMEWVLTQPIAEVRQPRIDAVFALAGVQRPERVILCEIPT